MQAGTPPVFIVPNQIEDITMSTPFFLNADTGLDSKISSSLKSSAIDKIKVSVQKLKGDKRPKLSLI